VQNEKLEIENCKIAAKEGTPMTSEELAEHNVRTTVKIEN
jgi:hypothetical protein